jgi:hypothetical protein
LKKLFADPHFNQMDGLDVYIDDYSKPDPMPPAFLKRLNQARILGLAEEEKDVADAPAESAAVPAVAAGPDSPPAGMPVDGDDGDDGEGDAPATAGRSESGIAAASDTPAAPAMPAASPPGRAA